jgi:hypothetical protein
LSILVWFDFDFFCSKTLSSHTFSTV